MTELLDLVWKDYERKNIDEEFLFGIDKCFVHIIPLLKLVTIIIFARKIDLLIR